MHEKSLIIYFSRIGENYTREGIVDLKAGNTAIAAHIIKDLTNSDIFEVKPLHDYPKNYRECVKVSVQELKEKSRPPLKEYLTDISSYDVIYIGTPIWCGTMPMPMFTQLEKLDFTGKKIKVFVTNEGSGVGNIVNDLKKICKNAASIDSISIIGSEVENSRSLIEEWVRK